MLIQWWGHKYSKTTLRFMTILVSLNMEDMESKQCKCQWIAYLDFIVLEENIGLEVVDSLVNNIRIYA